MKFLYLFVLLLFTGTTVLTDNNENIVIDEVDGSLNVGQKVEEVVTTQKKKYNISEHRLIQKSTESRPYSVYDNILPAKVQILLKSYITFDNEAWLFNNYDEDNVNKQRTHDNTPWINDLDPIAFSKTKLCKRLKRAVKDTSKDDGPYYPYRVFGKILRRGDHTRVAADSSDAGDYSAMIFVNEFWRKNYYGELYFYDKQREIIGGATHRAGRVAVWESTILRLNRPPAVQFVQGQILFQVQFSKDKSKMEEGHKKWLAYQTEREEAYKTWFLSDYKNPNGQPFTSPDPEKHLFREYTTKSDGRKIFVYDNLFSIELLNHLRSFVLKFGSYFYDDSIDSDSDNVQWIAGFLLKPYIMSPYWQVVKKVAGHATKNSMMFPYDISINLVRNSDHTRIHRDVSYYGEDEFTCLVYLNPNWTQNNYGETTFFENMSDDNEIVAQVRPRYGRTVIFDGNIPHSARPPSANFSGARLTFVTKLHKNEFYGRKKNFIEELRHYRTLLSSFDNLDVLKSKHGEKFAQQQIDSLRAMKTKLTFHPDKAEEGDDVENDDEENDAENKNNDGNETEEEDEEDESLIDMEKSEKSQPPPIENEADKEPIEDSGVTHIEDVPITDDGPEDIDEDTLNMIEPLDGLSEKKEESIEIFKRVHDEMRHKYDEKRNEYYHKIMEIL